MYAATSHYALIRRGLGIEDHPQSRLHSLLSLGLPPWRLVESKTRKAVFLRHRSRARAGSQAEQQSRSTGIFEYLLFPGRICTKLPTL